MVERDVLLENHHHVPNGRLGAVRADCRAIPTGQNNYSQHRYTLHVKLLPLRFAPHPRNLADKSIKRGFRSDEQTVNIWFREWLDQSRAGVLAGLFRCTY